MTLGSLFDGIGGFPLAAVNVGITPLWASEIEKAPVSITKKHFPEMKHLGDIKKIKGGKIQPVDIISFGSPCQDLSLAGQRAGLKGKRSRLFNHALRVIKEMRIATGNKYPIRIVWENVPGTFSSNGGKDFQTVIEEICKIAEPGISIPRPSQKSGWLASGGIVGDNFSLAWRVLNAKYFGVPQKRRRIFLMADFTSQCAGEILFKQESGLGDFEQSEKKEEGAARTSKGGVKSAGFNGWRSVTGSLEYEENFAPCIQANMPPNVVEQFCNNKSYFIDLGHRSSRIQMNADTAVTILGEGGGVGAKTGLYCLPFVCNGFGDYKQDDVGRTLLARDDTTTCDLIVNGYTVRRLTPLECERLQGYPDGWTEYGHDGRLISDNQRYKALGNSVAVPCVISVFSGF